MNALIAILLSVLFHELGHYLAATALSLKVKRCGFTWWPLGFYIVREPGAPIENAVVALSGPLLNLLIAATVMRVSGTLGLYNLVLAVSNLLPFPHTDGRRVLDLLADVCKPGGRET